MPQPSTLMAEYRKRIFGAMHGNKVLTYGPSPWIDFNPEKRKQAPLPALPPAVSRSIAKRRRRGTSSTTGSHILDFAQLKVNADALRKARSAQQQERRDMRVLKVATDEIRQREKDKVAKVRAQNIKEANDGVNILLLGGLDEHMKKKKGKTRDRHIRQFLDENLRAPLPGDGDEEPPEEPDDSKRDADTASQEQIARLKFEPGRKGEEPPTGAINKSYAIVTQGTARVIRFEHKYNFFKGMMANNTIMDIQLSPEWCENVFELVFTQLCRQNPGNWFHVPIGSAHGVPSVVIVSPPCMILGCWASDSFLDHIRPQVLEWSHDMTSRMIVLVHSLDVNGPDT
jgi:hypothetical protein